MPNQKVISMLGLARRAGKLSMGHGAARTVWAQGEIADFLQ